MALIDVTNLITIYRKTGKACPNRLTPCIRRRAKQVGMTGQFFLLGAFLITTLFFVGLPRPASMNVEGMEDMAYIAANLQKEMPNAFNLGLERGDHLDAMRNFTWFADGVLRNRRVTFGALLAFGNNISTADFNVTVLNYMGAEQAVNITVGSSMYVMLVANNASNSTAFTGVGSLLNISFKFGGEEKNMTWARDKYSTYGMLNLTRSDSVVIKDFEG